MVDDLVGEIDPAVRGNDPHQLLLNFLRRVAFGETKTVSDAEDVRVHHHAFGLAVGHAENDVSRLARRAGDGDQLGKRPAEPVRRSRRRSSAPRLLNRFGFVVKEIQWSG